MGSLILAPQCCRYSGAEIVTAVFCGARKASGSGDECEASAPAMVLLESAQKLCWVPEPNMEHRIQWRQSLPVLSPPRPVPLPGLPSHALEHECCSSSGHMPPAGAAYLNGAANMFVFCDTKSQQYKCTTGTKAPLLVGSNFVSLADGGGRPWKEQMQWRPCALTFILSWKI